MRARGQSITERPRGVPEGNSPRVSGRARRQAIPERTPRSFRRLDAARCLDTDPLVVERLGGVGGVQADDGGRVRGLRGRAAGGDRDLRRVLEVRVRGVRVLALRGPVVGQLVDERGCAGGAGGRHVQGLLSVSRQLAFLLGVSCLHGAHLCAQLSVQIRLCPSVRCRRSAALERPSRTGRREVRDVIHKRWRERMGDAAGALAA